MSVSQMTTTINTTLEFINTYQCPGCINGDGTDNCNTYEYDDTINCCTGHCPGTTIYPGGTIMLGFPTGFNKVGIFGEVQDIASVVPLQMFLPENDLWYDHLNIPVWMRLDEHGNTLVRGIHPRLNVPFLHVLIGDRRKEINNSGDVYGFKCIELTEDDLNKID